VAAECDSDLLDGIPLDGGGGTGCASALDSVCDTVGAHTSPLRLSNIAHGTHELRIWAVDPVGNVGAATSFKWIVDSRAPVAKVVSAPPGTKFAGGPTNAAHMRFEYTTDHGPIDNFECAASFECAIQRGVGAAPAGAAGTSPWSGCTSTPAGLCRASVEFSVRLLGATNAALWDDATVSAAVANVRTVLEAGGLGPPYAINHVGGGAATAVLVQPFMLVHRGGVQAGLRFATALAVRGQLFHTTGLTVAECQATCAAALNCVALHYVTAGGECYGA
jgi:hypothetical protein